MSFLDDIIDTGKQVIGWASGEGVGAKLARTAALGLLTYTLNKNVNKESSKSTAANPANTQPDRGARIQVNPDPEHSIPIVYGSSHLGGIIFDANIANNNRTMYYAFAICEKTGTKLSDNQASTFKFNDVYWSDNKLVFKNDGYTVDYMMDRNGNIDYSLQGLVKVYCYAGGSTAPIAATLGGTNPNVLAYNVMPGWTAQHTANNIVFAIVAVNYSREKNTTSLPTMKFQVTNSMNLPGDCLYDYMTNTRYGAGINPTEIYSG